MIALLRIDTMKQTAGGTVPDINAPGEWYGYQTYRGYRLVRGERELNLDGPHAIPGIAGSWYIADMPRGWLGTVQSWLGGATRANSMRRALNNSAEVRAWAKGFLRIARNSSNQPVTAAAPHTICGSDPVDFDLGEDETADDLPVMVDLD